MVAIMKLRPLLFALVLLGAALAGCATPDTDQDGAAPTATTQATPGGGAKPRYVVGTDAAFEPFESIDANGEFVGYDIDVINEVARRNNWDLDIRNMGFDPLLLAVENGQVDIAISAISINENRSKVMDFSIAYYEANQSIAQLASDAATYESLDDLRGKGLRFGVQSGTTAVDIVESEFVDKNDGTIKRYDTYPLALQALKAGEVDVVMMDEPAQRVAAESDPAIEVAFQFSTGDTYGIALPKGKTQMLNAINDALEAMQDDGTLAQLKAKWGI